MQGEGSYTVLSDRRQRVLQALVEDYIANAQPVGSRTLVDRYRLGVSPATVRNELSVLEEEGYITSPHTSSGRVPTDAGYRAFVDDLLARDFGDEAEGEAFDELREAATRVDDLMEETSAALSRLTDCLSVVLAPSLLNSAVKQVSLVCLSAHRVLMVVVTDDGQVFNRNIEFADEVSSESVADVQNAMNEVLSGKSVAEARAAASHVSSSLATPLARIFIEELAACLDKVDEGRAHRLGFSTLLNKPEFSNAQAVLPVLQVLEDDTVLMHLFDDVSSSGQPLEIRIGSENVARQLSGVSVVAAQYGPVGSQGVVAVIGPTRMDYSKVIRVVRAARSALRDL